MSEPTPMDEVINKSDDFMRIVGIAYDPSLAKQHIIEIEAQLSAARAAEQSLREEVERLKAEIHFAGSLIKSLMPSLMPYQERAAQAEAKAEALRVDAERYRFLADSNNYEESVKLISANLTEYQLDAAIDEARGVKP